MGPLLLVSLVALGCNVPLGVWRGTTRKLSWQWFVSLHLAVPLVIALRLAMDLPWASVPLLIGLAVLGQLVGGRLGKRLRGPVL